MTVRGGRHGNVASFFFFLVCFARLLRAATSSRLAKAVNIWHIFLLRVSLGVWLRSSTDHRTADCFSPFGHVWTCFFFGTLVDWCWIFFHRKYVRVALICQLKNYIFLQKKSKVETKLAKARWTVILWTKNVLRIFVSSHNRWGWSEVEKGKCPLEIFPMSLAVVKMDWLY